MALSKDVGLVFEAGHGPVINEIGVAASSTIYQGAALSMNAGYARPMTTTDDSFAGFAKRQADNSSGAAGDINVEIVSLGITKLTVTGVTATTEIGTKVYASDDGTFTTTAGTNVGVGRVHRALGSTSAMVAFESSSLRSLDTSEA